MYLGKLPVGNQTLAEAYPALYSHVKNDRASVFEVISTTLHSHLHPRLTRAAQLEKAMLQNIITAVDLHDQPDTRTNTFYTMDQQLDSAKIYRICTSEGLECAHYHFIWHSHAPPKVKSFWWLLVQQRLHCKVNLFHKNMIQDQTCELCKTSPEDAQHLVTDCPVARSFWLHMGWDSSELPQVTSPWNTQLPEHLPKECSATLLLCFWEI